MNERSRKIAIERWIKIGYSKAEAKKLVDSVIEAFEKTK